MPRASSPLPAPLSRAARTFEEWRRQRTRREIPAELWGTAADLAARYGVSRTAKALRVRYYDLRRRVPGAAAPGASPVRPPATFVEILGAAATAGSDAVVEYVHESGAKMRIRLRGAGAPILTDLSRVFLEARS